MISTEIFLVFVLIIVLVLLFVSISQCGKTGSGIIGGRDIIDSLKNVATNVKDKITSFPKMVQNRFSSDKAKQTESDYKMWANLAQLKANNSGERPIAEKEAEYSQELVNCLNRKTKIINKIDELNCNNDDEKILKIVTVLYPPN